MNAVVVKGLLALAAACVFSGVSMIAFLTRKDLGSALLGLGIGSFAIMAWTHVFEAFSVLPWLGWGRPHGVGHFIDLVAALLGVTLVTTSIVLRYVQQNRSGRGVD